MLNTKKLLDSLLTSYNSLALSTFQLESRIIQLLLSITYLINVSKFEDHIISPLVNGMADHDAQLIMINDKVKSLEY